MPRPRKIDQLREHESVPVCADAIVHVDTVRQARADLPASQAVAAMSGLFSALGDPTRLRIVAVLATREVCVCDLAAALGVSQSAVSHQLRLLRQVGLVRPRRDGRLVYYVLDDEHVATLFRQAHDHVRHQEEHGDD